MVSAAMARLSGKPLISIVTPVLNAAAFLPAAIESIIGQSYSNWEHRIIDAGSTDGGYERALEFQRHEPRITVERREGEPLYQSIMHGLTHARGDYLAWLNADDLYTPWAFAALADFSGAKTHARWVTGLPGCWDKDGTLRFVRASAWYPQSFIRRGMFHLHALGFLQQESMFFARTLFEDLTDEDRAGIGKQKLAGDFLLWKCFAEHAPLHVAPTVLGGFRRHGANQSITRMDEYMAEVRAIGAWTPPHFIGALARKAYWQAAALKGQRLVLDADDRLVAEIKAT